MNDKNSPKFLIVYRCEYCGQDSGYTEREKPVCRFCSRSNRLVVQSKDEITPEIIAARLRVVVDNMMANLTQAYQQLPIVGENVVSESDDSETMLLRLMHHAKKLRDKVYEMELRKKVD